MLKRIYVVLLVLFAASCSAGQSTGSELTPTAATLTPIISPTPLPAYVTITDTKIVSCTETTCKTVLEVPAGTSLKVVWTIPTDTRTYWLQVLYQGKTGYVGPFYRDTSLTTTPSPAARP